MERKRRSRIHSLLHAGSPPPPPCSTVDDSDADLSPRLVSPPVPTFTPVVEGADFLNKLFRNCVNQTLAEIVSVDVERFRVWRDFMAVHKIYLTCSSVLVVT
ncbi:hypothetical protein BS78_05G172600 [Paspalum vaginatum]|nr:hypothetical protein BS78_05G172600 [Paspalum vaginatum]